MKKLAIFLTVFFINIHVSASHLMGGELIVHNDQVGNYEILLTLYRDTLGIPMPVNKTIEIYSSSGNLVTTIVATLDPSAYHPVFGIQNGSVLPFFPYGVEVYFFTASFPCFIPGDYRQLGASAAEMHPSKTLSTLLLMTCCYSVTLL